jgi:hypothetical protein
MVIRYVGSFTASILVSTVIIQKLLPFLDASKPDGESVFPSGKGVNLRSVGFWIGFFETLLIFMFVSQKEFGALAIVMAAKEFVRKEKMAENVAYYLLGTLVNLSVAVLFALIAGY